MVYVEFEHPSDCFGAAKAAAIRSRKDLKVYHLGGDRRALTERDLPGQRPLWRISKTGEVSGPEGQPVLTYVVDEPPPPPAYALEFGSDKPIVAVKQVRRTLGIEQKRKRDRLDREAGRSASSSPSNIRQSPSFS